MFRLIFKKEFTAISKHIKTLNNIQFLPWTCPAGPARSCRFCCRVSSRLTCPSLRISGVRRRRLFLRLKDPTSKSRGTRGVLRSRRTFNLTNLFHARSWAILTFLPLLSERDHFIELSLDDSIALVLIQPFRAGERLFDAGERTEDNHLQQNRFRPEGKHSNY